LRQESAPRVMVTGLGVKTPCGSTLEDFWQGILSGQSFAAPIRGFDTAGFPVNFACEVRDFEPNDYFRQKELPNLDRASQLGIAAATDAIEDASLTVKNSARCGVVAGCAMGGLGSLHKQIAVVMSSGPQRINPLAATMFMPNATASLLSMRLGFEGPSLCVATACAAGADAIGEAVGLIRSGAADLVVAGGTEAAVIPATIAAFSRLGALSQRVDDPAAASRPYDRDRDGFVLGEAAAFLVLERADLAVTRGARIYAEAAGYGRNCDAYHLTRPVPGGKRALECMSLALADAGLAPSDVMHVNGHGTSTPLNDEMEAQAVFALFGLDLPPLTSVKGAVGHSIGAAGALEAVATILSVQNGLVPPTANCRRIDVNVDVDVVIDQPRPIRKGPGISNSFAFGGHNASLVFTPSPSS
jgi:3-oxoacyl-[acyl-carrier-protein] synthase II